MKSLLLPLSLGMPKITTAVANNESRTMNLYFKLQWHLLHNVGLQIRQDRGYGTGKSWHEYFSNSLNLNHKAIQFDCVNWHWQMVFVFNAVGVFSVKTRDTDRMQEEEEVRERWPLQFYNVPFVWALASISFVSIALCL